MDFDHAGARFSIVYLEGQNRIVLHVWASDAVGWERIHGKQVPKGMRPAEAMQEMCRFVTGQLTQEQYNAVLPGR